MVSGGFVFTRFIIRLGFGIKIACLFVHTSQYFGRGGGGGSGGSCGGCSCTGFPKSYSCGCSGFLCVGDFWQFHQCYHQKSVKDIHFQQFSEFQGILMLLLLLLLLHELNFFLVLFMGTIREFWRVSSAYYNGMQQKISLSSQKCGLSSREPEQNFRFVLRTSKQPPTATAIAPTVPLNFCTQGTPSGWAHFKTRKFSFKITSRILNLHLYFVFANPALLATFQITG